jgi:hypothetical protein
MRKHTNKKSLSLSTSTVRTLTDDLLAATPGAGFKTISIFNCTKPNPTVLGTCTC